MFNYEKAQLRALELLKYYGSEVQFISKGTSGGYNADGDVIPAQPDISINGTATPVVQFKVSEVDNKTVFAGDGYCFFQGEGDIAVGMQLTDNGLTYRVINVYPLRSNNGMKLFDKVHLRSG